MADEDVPLDAPPPYTTGETVTVPYADSLATGNRILGNKVGRPG